MNLRAAQDAMLNGHLELAGLADEQDSMLIDGDQQICGSKRKANCTNDDVGTIEHLNSSDEGAEAHGSDDEARKLRRYSNITSEMQWQLCRPLMTSALQRDALGKLGSRI